MNIVVGKIGKKFYFDKSKWTIDSGDSEVTNQIIVLANTFPDINFYVIGINDLDKFKDSMHKIFKHDNVINVWADYTSKEHKDQRQDYILNYFKKHDISIDFGWIHCGPISYYNIPEKSYKLSEPGLAKPNVMAQNYAGPIVNYLNLSGIKFVALGEDPMYFPFTAKDLHNRPIHYLNSLDKDILAKYYPQYLAKELVQKTEKLKNVGYDKLFLTSEKIPDRKMEPRSINEIVIFTNGNGTKGKKKLKIMRDYFNAQPMKIYGKWEDKFIEANEKYTFENLPMINMVDKLYDIDYTLMFNFEEDFPSSKFWKMIYFGIIPFFHKSYDIAKSQPVHPFLRINSPWDLEKKIKQLNEDPALKNEIREYHYNIMKEEYFNGNFLRDIFIEEIRIATDVKLELPSETDNYSKVSVLFPSEEVKVAEFKKKFRKAVTEVANASAKKVTRTNRLI